MVIDNVKRMGTKMDLKPNINKMKPIINIMGKRKTNVLIINSPLRLRKKIPLFEFGQEPLAVMYLAGVLISNGIKTHLKDYEVEKYDLNDLLRLIIKHKIEIVGIGCTCASFNSAQKIICQLKKRMPNLKIVLGGKHPSSQPKRTLMESKADIIMVDESEYNFLNLIETISKKESIDSVPNIYYFNHEGEFCFTERKIPLFDLNQVPFPPRNIFKHNKYKSYYNFKRYCNLLSSRGCPYSCTYCYNSKNKNKRIRFRSAENIFQEIKQIIDHYGIRQFQFIDDNFTMNKREVNILCDLIIKNKLNIKFQLQGRVDSAEKLLYQKLKKAGCTQITFGIETAVPQYLEFIQKKSDFDTVKKAVKIAKAVGLKIRGNFILGFPGETINTMWQTIRFAKELQLTRAIFFVLTP